MKLSLLPSLLLFSASALALPQTHQLSSPVSCRRLIVSPGDSSCTTVMSADHCSALAQKCSDGKCYEMSVPDHTKADPIECPPSRSYGGIPPTPLTGNEDEPSAMKVETEAVGNESGSHHLRKKRLLANVNCLYVCPSDPRCGTYEFDRTKMRCGCACQACPIEGAPGVTSATIAKAGDNTTLVGATRDYTDGTGDLTDQQAQQCPHVKYPLLDDAGQETITWPAQ